LLASSTPTGTAWAERILARDESHLDAGEGKLATSMLSRGEDLSALRI
jgi:hypothetical protein